MAFWTLIVEYIRSRCCTTFMSSCSRISKRSKKILHWTVVVFHSFSMYYLLETMTTGTSYSVLCVLQNITFDAGMYWNTKRQIHLFHFYDLGIVLFRIDMGQQKSLWMQNEKKIPTAVWYLLTVAMRQKIRWIETNSVFCRFRSFQRCTFHFSHGRISVYRCGFSFHRAFIYFTKSWASLYRF